MKVDIYMPVFIGDYLRDTTDLTTEEHGAYLLILMSMWTAGGSLPEKKLAAIARVPPQRWPEVWETLSRFFSVEDGRATQGRLSGELERAESMREKARENGLKGGRPKTQDKPDGKPRNNPPVNPSVNRPGNPGETSSPSPSDLRSHLQIPDPDPSGARARGLPSPEPVGADRQDPKPNPKADPDVPLTAFELLRLFDRLRMVRWKIPPTRGKWDARDADVLFENFPPGPARNQFAKEIKPAIERFLADDRPAYVDGKHKFQFLANNFDAFRGPEPPKPKDTGPVYQRLTGIPMVDENGYRRDDPNARKVGLELLAKQRLAEAAAASAALDPPR